MGYPEGALLSALAPRIRENLDRIQELASASVHAFEDTQLLVSLLGVLVFPQQRSDEALRGILGDYEPLPDAVTVLHAEVGGVVLFPGDPAVRAALPRLLRNGLAHANILPLRARRDFAGIRIWNEDDWERVTFVADLAFPEVRRLAHYVLGRLAEADPRLDNPVDPLTRLASQGPIPRKRRLEPTVSDTVWNRLVAACGRDTTRARTEMDRALSARARAIEGGA